MQSKHAVLLYLHLTVQVEEFDCINVVFLIQPILQMKWHALQDNTPNGFLMLL